MECLKQSAARQEHVMATPEEPAEAARIVCDVCLKEVPADEAVVPEGVDYFVHFCGLQCYQEWVRRSGKPQPKDEESGS
jgi:Domain of unknown function (DUF3330)